MDKLQYIQAKHTPSQPASGGIGCLTVLGLIFIVLKLTGNIDWSWWWVLSPFIFQFGIMALLILIVAIFAIRR